MDIIIVTEQIKASIFVSLERVLINISLVHTLSSLQTVQGKI